MDDKLHTMGGNMVRLGIIILLLVGSCCFADSPPQDSTEANPPDGGILALTFNAGPGAKDWSSGRNDGTVEGATYSYGSGVGGGAYVLDGANDYIDIQSVLGDMETTTEATVCMWIKPADLAENYSCMFSFGDASAFSTLVLFRQGATDGTLYVYCIDGGDKWKFYSTGVVQVADVWQHIVFRFDGTIQTVWVNGKGVSLNHTITTDTTYWFSDFSAGAIDSATLGSDNWNNQGNREFWKGEMDEVMIFSRALTALEIEELYEKGKANFK